MFSGQGNRGQAFEDVINLVNHQYKINDIALIHKRATPVKVLKSKGSRVLNGFFEEKSTVDFDGVYRGRPIYFEAKTVKEKRFDLKNLHKHQMQHLYDANLHGAISFLLIEIRPVQTVYLVPFNMVAHYWKKAAQGGRKSIPLSDFEVYAYEVKRGRGVLLDYLAVLDHIETERAVST